MKQISACLRCLACLALVLSFLLPTLPARGAAIAAPCPAAATDGDPCLAVAAPVTDGRTLPDREIAPLPEDGETDRGSAPSDGGYGTYPMPRPEQTAGSATVLPLGARGAQKGAKSTGELRLVPGGMPFGIRIHTAGAMIVGLSEVVSGGRTVRPAYDAGVRTKDILIEIDGVAIKGAEDATKRIAAAGDRPLCFTLLRGDERVSCTVTPQKSDKDGRYQCGVWIRDTTSGIGTVTFMDPDSGLFGGLGHGVCDSDTGALVPLSSGSVQSVRLTGVVRGAKGTPGELKGAFSGGRIGSLVTNSECGVFGLLSDLPKASCEALPVAAAGEVKEGPATLLCTLGDDGIREYSVEISKIDHGGRPTKSFTVHVTDPTLLSRTGGIVQGMSGSPLIQDGKLIGAVTHVLVDDPTTGYGIFLENMLAAMKMRAVA